MYKLLRALPIVACLYAYQAQAQQFDGTWTGQAGLWTVTMTVTGTKARLTMSCGGTDGLEDFTISANGSFSAYIKTGAGRRNITGTMPTIQVPPGGSCGGGTATLTKK